jgi:hypothetical protein
MIDEFFILIISPLHGLISQCGSAAFYTYLYHPLATGVHMPSTASYTGVRREFVFFVLQMREALFFWQEISDRREANR